MNELKALTPQERVEQLIQSTFNRSIVDKMIQLEECDLNTLSLVEKVQEFYLKLVNDGDFDIHSIVDVLQCKDEEALHAAAEIIINSAELYRFYEHNDRGSYEDTLDSIEYELMINEDIALFHNYPIISKAYIPNIILYALDSMKASYYVLDPPPGSYQAYCGELVCEVYYNDAQNLLIDECKISDGFDDSHVVFVRKPKKYVRLEATA